MAHGAGPPLQQAAPDGKARLARIIEIGQQLHHLAAVQQLGVDAVEAHDVALARLDVELGRAVGQHDLAALGDHDVEVEVVGEALPQLQRMFEKAGVAVDHVVGADQRGVAADIAGTDIAALETATLVMP